MLFSSGLAEPLGYVRSPLSSSWQLGAPAVDPQYPQPPAPPILTPAVLPQPPARPIQTPAVPPPPPAPLSHSSTVVPPPPMAKIWCEYPASDYEAEAVATYNSLDYAITACNFWIRDDCGAITEKNGFFTARGIGVMSEGTSWETKTWMDCIPSAPHNLPVLRDMSLVLQSSSESNLTFPENTLDQDLNTLSR